MVIYAFFAFLEAALLARKRDPDDGVRDLWSMRGLSSTAEEIG
jgi:hypothetical protein